MICLIACCQSGLLFLFMVIISVYPWTGKFGSFWIKYLGCNSISLFTTSLFASLTLLSSNIFAEEIEPLASSAPSEYGAMSSILNDEETIENNTIKSNSSTTKNEAYDIKEEYDSFNSPIQFEVKTVDEQLEEINNSNLSESQKEIGRIKLEVERKIESIENSNLTESQKGIKMKNTYDEITSQYQPNNLQLKSQITAAASTWSHLPGTFYMYTQQAQNYCTAAAAQCVIRYLTGNSPQNQATIYEYTKSDPNVLRTYLNTKQSANTYIMVDPTSISKMNEYFSYAMNIFHAPPVLAVRLSTTNGWAYNTGVNGHVFMVNAKSDDNQTIQIADTYMGYAGLGDWCYKRPATSVHSAMQNGGGYMY